jgi:shikimate kinase
MNLILCGLPYSGKTSVATKIAQARELPLIDTDRKLEALYYERTAESVSCREIYRRVGEKAFRELESEVIMSLKGTESSVIAIGGGTLINPANVRLLKSIGTLIYLQAHIDTLLERILASEVPAYLRGDDPRQMFQKLVEERLSTIEGAADVTIDTDTLTIDDITQEILTY